MTPKDKREIAKLLRMAEVIASEPYANPEAAVINLIKVLKLMTKDDSDE